MKEDVSAGVNIWNWSSSMYHENKITKNNTKKL